MRRGFSLLFCIKKVCTYLISWTYADKLHTLKCIIYFHNVRQQAHKKTSSKTGFTLVCYSFRSYYIFLLKNVKQKFSETALTAVGLNALLSHKLGQHKTEENLLFLNYKSVRHQLIYRIQDGLSMR